MRFYFLSLLVANLSFAAGPFLSDPDKAFAQAKKLHQPVLIDFYGIWCPPCNQMNETVFETPAFLTKAKGFVLLKVDVDNKASWKWKDQYRVGGYPTYVFTDPAGQELYRVVGARTPRTFLQTMDMVKTLKNKDVSQACKSSDTDDLWRCAVTCSERDETKCAEEAYQKLENKLAKGSPRYLLARTYFVEHAANEDLRRNGFEKLMEDFPTSPQALSWADEYLSLFPKSGRIKPKTTLLENVAKNYDKIKKDSDLDAYGLLPTDLAEMHASLLGRLGKPEEARAAWKEAADLQQTLAKYLPAGSLGRGFAIERIGCLDAAGEQASALALANEYRVKFPDEFTFHFWAATILDRQKKYAESLPVAQKAYRYSYGDNKIRAGILLIQVMNALSDKEGAKKTYQEIVDEIKPSSDLQIRTHRYLKQLDEVFRRSQT